MEGVPALVAPADGSFRERDSSLAPVVTLRWKKRPPSSEGLRAVRSPSLTARFFHLIEEVRVSLGASAMRHPSHGGEKESQALDHHAPQMRSDHRRRPRAAPTICQGVS